MDTSEQFLGQLLRPGDAGVPRTLFHASKQRLEPGGIVRSENYAAAGHAVFFAEPSPKEFAAIPDFRARCQVEKAFEEIRQSVHSELPTRRVCLFASLTLNEAERWRTQPARSTAYLYELLPLGDSLIVILDYVWFNYAVRIAKELTPPVWFHNDDKKSEISCAAAHYWNGRNVSEVFRQRPRYEVLVFGTLAVANRFPPATS